MGPILKPLDEQTIVITGATSGIGLVTARMAAERGARLVLAARGEDALDRLVAEIERGGGRAVRAVADVGDEAAVRRIAATANEAFGGFDTWVNDAGVSIYGKLAEVPVADMRHLFETNVWGVVYGSLVAAEGLKQRGGAIINIGSTLSERAILLQGIYSASKHAVKGFTDALRMELEKDGAPISVTLIKPAAIDTPYVQHAKNFMDVAASIPPPVYAPETVARTILHAAEHPTREVFVGSGGAGLAALGTFAPRLADKVMETMFAGMQQGDGPPGPREQNGLDRAAGSLEERGGYDGMVRETSLYTEASLHPLRTGAVLVGAGVAGAALWRAATANNGTGTGHASPNGNEQPPTIGGALSATKAVETEPQPYAVGEQAHVAEPR